MRQPGGRGRNRAQGLAPAERVQALKCWQGPVAVEPLKGGITNTNFLASDSRGRFVVRLGDDIPVHHIMRFSERAASLAAFAAGLSPEVVHHEPGVLVMRYIDGETMTAEKLREAGNLRRLVALVRQCHRAVPQYLRGPVLVFWPFHVIRDYGHALRAASGRWRQHADRLVAAGDRLERAIVPLALAFCHNDLLPANVIDDGKRLWLVDWDYAGFGSPLFDLANLATNAECDEAAERMILADYFERAPDGALLQSFRAMRCVSLLREAMWGMVSASHSTLDFDYHAYAQRYLERFERDVAVLGGG